MNGDSELHEFYKNKSKDWIFLKTYRKYYIEDDEILDLESLSLSNNEDTWLYSSEEIPLANSNEIESSSDELNSPLIASSNLLFDERNFGIDVTQSASSISSLIDVNNCSDSLIHLPDVSQTTIDNYLNVTPVGDTKSKSYRKIALSNQFHANYVNLESEKKMKSPFRQIKTDRSRFQTFKPVHGPTSESDGFALDEVHSHHNDHIDRNYILNSVENKLLPETNDSSDNSNFHSRPFCNYECSNNDGKQTANNEVKTLKVCDNGLKIECLESAALDENNIKVYDSKVWSKVVSSKNSPLVDRENEENDCRSISKKYIPFSQSTPMLLNRYWKYNKSVDHNQCFSKRRMSRDFLKESTTQAEKDINEDEMNTSDFGDGSFHSPSENDGAITEINTNLNATYFKSDCNLNSTYDIHGDDDQTSSISESSMSSAVSRGINSDSFQHVQKKAALQERSLQTHLYSNYFVESSRSSEVSSSNESISAFSPSSSSNEGSVDTKTNCANQNAQKLIHPIGTHLTNRTLLNSPNKCDTNAAIVVQPMRYKGNEGRARNLQKERGHHNVTSMGELPPVKADPLPKSTPILNNSTSATGVRSSLPQPNENDIKISQNAESNVERSIFLSKSYTKTIEERRNQPSTLDISAKRDEINGTTHLNRSVSPAPVSHIPRPSSKIPKLRSSNSCTRYGKNSCGIPLKK